MAYSHDQRIGRIADQNDLCDSEYKDARKQLSSSGLKKVKM